MNDKTRNKIGFKFGIGSVSAIVSILGITIWYLSSIVVDAKQVLDVPEWIGGWIIFLGWYIGNKYHKDFGAKWGKNVSMCFTMKVLGKVKIIENYAK